MKGGKFYRQKQRISRLTDDLSGGAIDRLLNVEAPNYQLYKGDKITLVDEITGLFYELVLDADVAPTDTSMTIVRETLPSIKRGAVIMFMGQQQIKGLRDTYYHRIHINATYLPTKANYNKKYLAYGGNYSFDVSANDFGDGASKNNNWGTKWGWFSAINDCKIVEINILHSSRNQTGTGGPFDTEFALYSAKPTVNASPSNLTMNELYMTTLTGTTNGAYVYKTNSTSIIDLEAGAQLIPVFGPLSGAPESSSNTPDFYAEIEIIIQCNR